ncbi:class I SAM-dependent methyltransferase [Streptomyces sp. WMMC500]|uniref:class I SAM-dependent methyltransferase n=1 Tax=Streptomyces sp. WMMC500 TaxID=3015154 RepID=UPI00248C9309|nr:class I SAM-dependent methyltransferase [Streptomyces sp. WMMC500]WBB62496.1 class I SAM-dependent methyltransferase [Streptomyces sp. WMMC500]
MAGDSAGATGTSAPKWSDELSELERAGEISVPWVRQAAEWLAGRGRAARILDVGSGPGWAASVLAASFPAGEVVAVDATPEFVARAAERFAGLGLGGRARAERGELDSAALDRLGPADLVWSSHVVHHLPDPVDGLRRLGRLLAPGGVLALAEGGLPARYLPGGYGVAAPGFVSRLEAALSDYFVHHWSLTAPAVGGGRDWPLLLADAGLHHLDSRTFLLDVPAPVDDQVRAYVVDRFTQIADRVGDRLDAQDAAALGRLLDPDDEAALVNRPDLFLLSAFTVHLAGPGAA